MRTLFRSGGKAYPVVKTRASTMMLLNCAKQTVWTLASLVIRSDAEEGSSALAWVKVEVTGLVVPGVSVPKMREALK